MSFSWATSDTVIAESRQHQGVLEVAEKTPVNYSMLEAMVGPQAAAAEVAIGPVFKGQER